MRKLLIALGALAVLAGAGYAFRLQLLLLAAPIMIEWRDGPVGPNIEIEWPRGPEQPTAPPSRRLPNIVVILADDLGFNDISFYNGGAADGSLQTPHIDSIARDGAVFTNGYAANAVCAPSRASIMTGRYSTRFGFEFTPVYKIIASILRLMDQQAGHHGPQSVIHDDALEDYPDDIRDMGMPAAERTMAEVLRERGYHTGHIGKWHLGGAEGEVPEDQGFHNSLNLRSLLYLPVDSPDVVNARIHHEPIDNLVWTVARYEAAFNGGPSFEPRGYLTDYYTDEAVRFIDANRHRPFFLYLAHWGIHNPLQALRSDYEALSHIQDHKLRVYAAMIRALDRGVGKVLDRLREHGLDENTIVVFSSDNGGAQYVGLRDINKPFRGWKLTHFEGGTHVPYFVKWPARIRPGTVLRQPVGHIDLLPTLASAAGVRDLTKGVPDGIIDGVSLLPWLQNPARRDAPHDTLFWLQGNLRTVLHKGWKLIHSGRLNKNWLFDLRNDPTEQTNLAETEPQRVRELTALLDAHAAGQAEPLWDNIIEGVTPIDKHGGLPYEEGDEYLYWPN